MNLTKAFAQKIFQRILSESFLNYHGPNKLCQLGRAGQSHSLLFVILQCLHFAGHKGKWLHSPLCFLQVMPLTVISVLRPAQNLTFLKKENTTYNLKYCQHIHCFTYSQIIIMVLLYNTRVKPQTSQSQIICISFYSKSATGFTEK